MLFGAIYCYQNQGKKTLFVFPRIFLMYPSVQGTKVYIIGVPGHFKIKMHLWRGIQGASKTPLLSFQLHEVLELWPRFQLLLVSVFQCKVHSWADRKKKRDFPRCLELFQF